MVSTHVIVDDSERNPLPGAIATEQADPHATIQVTIKLRRKRKLPPLVERPSKRITRKTLAANYGASESDIEKVVETFARFNLSVIASNPATRSVRLSGSISAMEQAFQVKLLNYTHPNGDYRGRVGSLYVPIELKDIVEGIFGLDNRRVVRRPQRQARFGFPGGMDRVPSYIPSELAAHYHFPPGDGSGQTIGVLEFGGGYFPDDLKQFCDVAEISVPPRVSTVSVYGGPLDADRNSDSTREVMLDVEVLAGICPKAHIVVYFSEWSEQGVIEAIDAAVHDDKHDPGVLSISWGEAEQMRAPKAKMSLMSPSQPNIWSLQGMRQVDEILCDAALLGITVCVSAGDDGSSNGAQDGKVHVSFPASSPHVLAIGGTKIPVKGGKGPDVVWKEGDGVRPDGGSTGGGVSAAFPRPEWQKDVTIKSIDPNGIDGRCIPDISANADWDWSPYLMVANATEQLNGGTSAATPLIAGLLTLINASRATDDRVGYLTPVLYQTDLARGQTIGAAGCTDVRSGNNNIADIGGYAARKGYDAVSGWGTPDGIKLAALLSPAPPPKVDDTPLIIATEYVL